MEENESMEEHAAVAVDDDASVYVRSWSTMMTLMILLLVEMFEFPCLLSMHLRWGIYWNKYFRSDDDYDGNE